MRLKALAVIAASAAGVAACATGGGPGTHPNEPIRALLSADVMMFVSWDTNGDLSVSPDEIEAGITREFNRADANHDGRIEPIEYQAWANAVLGGTNMGPYRLDFDRNVDNAITREEFANEIHGRARDYDTDENGSLSRAEFVRLVGQARPVRMPGVQVNPQVGTERPRN
ncbi:MAG: EF-hand domain-containing protein [Proteobacteria bacterium]|nr:EF-hand domain-containing protein [Pseudomonadota bacterium]